MGLTYEDMRLFYNGSEEREQKLIVTNQRLMIRIKELERENAKLRMNEGDKLCQKTLRAC